GSSREDRRGVAVVAYALDGEIEGGVPFEELSENRLVPKRGFLPSLFPVNMMHILDRDVDALHQRFSHHQLVRSRIVGRHVTIVAQEEVYLGPIDVLAGRYQLVEPLRRIAA